MLYTFDLDYQQLERFQDFCSLPLRLFHYRDERFLDHFVFVLDCEPGEAVMLYLL